MKDQHHMDPSEILADLIQDIRIAMFTTVEADGRLRSRPIATQQSRFDGTLWFFTELDSPKVYQIDGKCDVNIAYASPADNLYISVTGSAEVSRDRGQIEELWNAFLKTYFPKGKDDPNLGLLKVQVRGAQYWRGPASKIIQLAGMAKAALTGTRYNQGEDRKIDMASGAVSPNLQKTDR